jgi:hypothetical protein
MYLVTALCFRRMRQGLSMGDDCAHIPLIVQALHLGHGQKCSLVGRITADALGIQHIALGLSGGYQSSFPLP